MSRNIQETKSKLCVSRLAQTALATAATINARFMVDSGGLLKIDYDREDNAGELTGYEGASAIIPFGQLSSGEMNQKRATPDFVLWAFAFALGKCDSEAAGALGYKHTITQMTGSQPEVFTGVQVLGDVLKRERYVGNAISEITLGLTDKWITAKASVRGTGKIDRDWENEVVAAAENAVSLTVTQNIEGATEPERLNSIHYVRVKKTGETHWTEVVVTGSATATTIDITAPGEVETEINYNILYVPEVETYFENLPSPEEECYLKIMDLTVKIGAKWSGTAIEGGRTVAGDFLNGEIKLANELDVRYVPGSGIAYGGDIERTGRTVVFSLSKKMRDVLMEHWRDTNEYFAAHVKAEGIEYEDGHKYTVEIILPKLGINTHQITVNNKIFAEEGDLMGLEGTYAPIIVVGKNKIENYIVVPE